MNKRILLIDLDTPCFASAAAVEDRWVIVTHNPSKKTKIFKNRTEFKNRLKEKGTFDKLDEYSFEDDRSTEPIQNACHILNNMIKNIETYTQPDEIRYFISGKDNFRDNLEFKTKYKSNRVEMIKPLLLSDVRQFAINKFKPEICNGDEADDRIIYRAYELMNEGHDVVVSTIDKDANAYTGISLFNQDKPENGITTVPELGKLWIDSKNKVRGIGFIWYCVQMLDGDPTDTYKPTELCGVKYGEKSAYKDLIDCTSIKELLGVVLSKYKEWYPESVTYKAWDGKEYTKDWFQIASLYHKAVRMKETPDDPLDFREFCNKHGVEVNE